MECQPSPCCFPLVIADAIGVNWPDQYLLPSVTAIAGSEYALTGGYKQQLCIAGMDDYASHGTALSKYIEQAVGLRAIQ